MKLACYIPKDTPLDLIDVLYAGWIDEDTCVIKLKTGEEYKYTEADYAAANPVPQFFPNISWQDRKRYDIFVAVYNYIQFGVTP